MFMRGLLEVVQVIQKEHYKGINNSEYRGKILFDMFSPNEYILIRY